MISAFSFPLCPFHWASQSITAPAGKFGYLVYAVAGISQPSHWRSSQDGSWKNRGYSNSDTHVRPLRELMVMLISITSILNGRRRGKNQTNTHTNCLLRHIFAPEFQKILDRNEGFSQLWWSQLSSCYHSSGQKQAHPMQLTPEHGRRIWAKDRTNTV